MVSGKADSGWGGEGAASDDIETGHCLSESPQTRVTGAVALIGLVANIRRSAYCTP